MCTSNESSAVLRCVFLQTSCAIILRSLRAVVVSLIGVTALSIPQTSPADESMTSPAFRDGLADRQAWEAWFGELTGTFRLGAEFWASHRSDSRRPDCATMTDPTFRAGCEEAKTRLTKSDRRRRTEADYKAGWNSPLDVVDTEMAAHTRPPSPSITTYELSSQVYVIKPDVFKPDYDDGSRYASIWGPYPPGRQISPHVVRIDMTSDEYQDQFNKLAAKGYCLFQVNGYAVGKIDHYAAIWIREAAPEEPPRCPTTIERHALTAESYQRELDNLEADGYLPSLISGYTVGNVDLYAGIFEKTEGPSRAIK
jgi:hypothetical protein